MDKIIDLAKKLKALSEQGIGGEKSNAATFLEKLMKKHGITIEMLKYDRVKEHEFFVADDQYKFWKQVVANVIGLKFNVSRLKTDKKKNKSKFINCTAEQAMIIHAKFEFYYKAYNQELEIFYAAFIQRNKLYADGDPDDKELTQEERDRLRKIFKMMQSMDEYQFHKQLVYKK